MYRVMWPISFGMQVGPTSQLRSIHSPYAVVPDVPVDSAVPLAESLLPTLLPHRRDVHIAVVRVTPLSARPAHHRIIATLSLSSRTTRAGSVRLTSRPAPRYAPRAVRCCGWCLYACVAIALLLEHALSWCAVQLSGVLVPRSVSTHGGDGRRHHHHLHPVSPP